MEKLFQYSAAMVSGVNTGFKRYLYHAIIWTNRLNIITGARGVGKTTLMLQYIKENLAADPAQVIYVNLDDLYFSRNTIVDFAAEFVKRGGKYLFLDEIHKYPNWSQEIKNIYDYFKDLRMVVTGSSALNIFSGKADLSRRAVVYRLNGLSFREFIELKYKHQFPATDINHLLTGKVQYLSEIPGKIKPVKLFEEYLQSGYYPFFTEGEHYYADKIKQTVYHVLENDLPSVENIDFTAVHNLRKLLSVITEIAPFKPNILKLSRQIDVSRETLLKYLYLLSKADLLMLLQADTRGISRMNKPEKVYLNNPNMIYALADSSVNTGNVRETFFYNQLKEKHRVQFTGKGDFLVDKKYLFEVGGKNKTGKQLTGLKNSYIAADNIEYRYQNKIPLWAFGFLY